MKRWMDLKPVWVMADLHGHLQPKEEQEEQKVAW